MTKTKVFHTKVFHTNASCGCGGGCRHDIAVVKLPNGKNHTIAAFLNVGDMVTLILNNNGKVVAEKMKKGARDW